MRDLAEARVHPAEVGVEPRRVQGRQALERADAVDERAARARAWEALNTALRLRSASRSLCQAE